MTTESAENQWELHHLELKKVAKGNEAAPDYLRRLMHLFLSDFELSMQKRLDILFWNKLKNLINGMREASEGDRLVDVNVQNLAVGFLTDLCLLIHENYEIPEMGVPEYFTWTLPGKQRREVKSRTKSKLFGAHFMLRMGDLMRYKNNIQLAREYYQTSIRITPIDGAAWNQMGILAAQSAQYLESVYYHTRALHASLEFGSATGNLNGIFKQFANRDSSKPMPINELFLSALAKIHFLLPIENSEQVLEKLGEQAATSKEMIISLMSVYQNLEGGTDLETRALEYVSVIWITAYKRLLERILATCEAPDDLLHLVALLHSASEFSDDVAEEADRVGGLLLKNASESEEFKRQLVDTDGFRFFQCVHNLEYPLTREKIAEFLIIDDNCKEEEEDENDGEVFGKTSSESENSPTKSTATSEDLSPKKKERRVFDSDSEEEILMRGRRRGRAQQLDSNDTDDDDF